MGPLTERFKALPIDTFERLEKTIDLVFEKVMYKMYIKILFFLSFKLFIHILYIELIIY